MLSGLPTIYALGQEGYFNRRFESALHANMQWLLSKDMSNLWMEQRLGLVASLLVGTLAAMMVLKVIIRELDLMPISQ